MRCLIGLRGLVLSGMCLVLASLALGACSTGGGGDKPPDGRPTPDNTPEATAKPDENAKPELQQLVKRVTESSKKLEFSGTSTVSPGDKLLMLTSLRNQSSIAGEKLRIAIPSRAAKNIKVRAEGPGKLRSVAQVSGEGGRPIVLTNLKYTCLQPGKTFCPVALTMEDNRFSAELSIPAEAASVAIVAEVVKAGEVEEQVTLPRGSQDPVVQQQLRVAAPKPSPELTSEVSAGPGSIVQVVPEITNLESAAGSKFKIVIPRGAAKSLSIGGGPAGSPNASTATITGADGKSVKIDGLRYNCVLEPAGFCPLKIETTEEKYTLRGRVPTARVPIVISLTLAAG